eukprot:gene26783-35471_t
MNAATTIGGKGPFIVNISPIHSKNGDGGHDEDTVLVQNEKLENGIANFNKNEASSPVHANAANSFLQNSNFHLSPTDYDNNFQETFKMHGGIEVGDKIVFGFAKNELSMFVDPSFSVAAKQYEESGLPSSISLLQDSSPYHHSVGKRPVFPETPVRGIMKHSGSQQSLSKSSDENTKRRRSFSDGEGGGGNFNYANLSEVQSQRDDGLHKLSDLRHSASSSSQHQQQSHRSSLSNQHEPVAVPLVVGATYTIQLDGSGCPIMVPWTAPFHQSARSTSPLSSSTFLRSAQGLAHRSAVPQVRRSFAATASSRPARQNYSTSYTISHNSLSTAEDSPRYATASKVKPAESKFQSIYKEYYSLNNSDEVNRARPPLSVKSASTTPSRQQHQEMPAFSTPTFSHAVPPPLYSSPTDPTSISEARQSEFWRKRLASRELTTVLRSPQLQF